MSTNKYCTQRNHPLILQANKKGLSITDVCRQIGCTNKTFYTWLNSPSRISLGTLIKFCGLYELSIYELIYLIQHTQAKIKPSDRIFLDNKMQEIIDRNKD